MNIYKQAREIAEGIVVAHTGYVLSDRMEDPPKALEVEEAAQEIEYLVQQGIEDYISDVYGERCKTKDTVDFPELLDNNNSSRCACCVAWEDYDEWRATKEGEQP